MAVSALGGTRVSVLLLADPTRDGRVIKTVRSLGDAGYRVTLFCVASRSAESRIPDLAGASIRWVTAPRPLAAIGSVYRRLRRRSTLPASHAPERHSARWKPSRRSLPAEMRALLGTLWLEIALARAAWHGKTDLIHANDLDTLLAGTILRWRHSARLLYDAHELYPEMVGGVSPLYAGIWRLLEHRLIRRADAVITVDASLAVELQRRHRLPRRPSIVMNCPPLEPAPAATGEADDRLLVLYQGALLAGRGLEQLLELVPHLDLRAVLCLRGSGPLLPTLRDLARHLGIEARVRFLDPVPPDQLVSRLGGFTIGLIPYLPSTLNIYLSAPNKLFEYLMGGLPVVASDLPEILAIHNRYGFGTLYSLRDPAALVPALNALIADPARMRQCREAALRAARDEFNWAAQERTLLALYRTIRAP